jgi:hypothetical protein
MRRAEPASHRACLLISFLNEFVSEENKGQDAQLFLRDCFVFDSRKWASCPASFATLSDAESYSRERGATADGSVKRKNFGNISSFRKGFKVHQDLKVRVNPCGQICPFIAPLTLTRISTSKMVARAFSSLLHK